jgi:hypothetical protein
VPDLKVNVVDQQCRVTEFEKQQLGTVRRARMCMFEFGIDVTVSEIFARSHRTAAAAGMLEASAEAEKQRVYRRFTHETGLVVIPFAITSAGGYGKGAQAIIGLIDELLSRSYSKFTTEYFVQQINTLLLISTRTMIEKYSEDVIARAQLTRPSLTPYTLPLPPAVRLASAAPTASSEWRRKLNKPPRRSSHPPQTNAFTRPTRSADACDDPDPLRRGPFSPSCSFEPPSDEDLTFSIPDRNPSPAEPLSPLPPLLPPCARVPLPPPAKRMPSPTPLDILDDADSADDVLVPFPHSHSDGPFAACVEHYFSALLSEQATVPAAARLGDGRLPPFNTHLNLLWESLGPTSPFLLEPQLTPPGLTQEEPPTLSQLGYPAPPSSAVSPSDFDDPDNARDLPLSP